MSSLDIFAIDVVEYDVEVLIVCCMRLFVIGFDGTGRVGFSHECTCW